MNYNQFVPAMKKKFGFDIFTTLFEKSFFSHHIGLRKPNKESFEYIIKNQGTEKEEKKKYYELVNQVRQYGICGFIQTDLDRQDPVFGG